MMYITFIVLILLVFLTKFYWETRKVWRHVKKLPGPTGLPLMGNIMEFKIHPTKILQKLHEDAKKYGGVFRYNFSWIVAIVITDYDHIEAILSTTKVLHKSEEYEWFQGWLGTGLLTSGPEKWKKTRKVITPTFHFQILEQFIEVFDSCSRILIEKLNEISKNSQPIDIYDPVTLCALDVICETAMGTKVNAQLNSDSEYVRYVKEISRVLRERIFKFEKRLNFTYYLTKDYQIEQKALKVVHGYTDSVIRKRREELLSRRGSVSGQKKRLAFLDLLLQSTLDGRPMTDEEIRQEVDTFMFEGHDTTAFAISCTLYCLSKHKDIQEKVVREIEEIFGADKDRPVTENDLQKMKYMEMVIKETLRLYPSVPFFARKVVEDTQIGTTIIPAGVTCNIFAWGLHRNPDLYPDPEKFDPERFTLENQSKRRPFSYIPFSAGPRNCIGQRFAMMEMKSTISKVLRNFEIGEVPEFEPKFLPDLILKPYDGLKIKLTPR